MSDAEQRKLVEGLQAECEWVWDDGRCTNWLLCKRLKACPIIKHNEQLSQVAQVKENEMSIIDYDFKYELGFFWVWIALRRKATGAIEPTAQNIVWRGVMEEYVLFERPKDEWYDADGGFLPQTAELVTTAQYGVVGQGGEGPTWCIRASDVYDTEEECQAAIDDGSAVLPFESQARKG